MKITDEEIQKDLEFCSLNKADTEMYLWIAKAKSRWPLYIKELKELREEIEELKESLSTLDLSLQLKKIQNLIEWVK